jgi:hypothetical protein
MKDELETSHGCSAAQVCVKGQVSEQRIVEPLTWAMGAEGYLMLLNHCLGANTDSALLEAASLIRLTVHSRIAICGVVHAHSGFTMRGFTLTTRGYTGRAKMHPFLGRFKRRIHSTTGIQCAAMQRPPALPTAVAFGPESPILAQFDTPEC